ncbi:hypothetical protein [Shimazuella kribbensis]|uniref:hypothetical protein n=1 Tax=Shimazuella kribbensis TaxID=139808 RepID=UPI0004286D6B
MPDNNITNKPRSLLYSKRWGYIAAIVLLPYALLKTLWAWGMTLGLTNDAAIRTMSNFGDNIKGQSPLVYGLYKLGLDFTTILAIIASIFALAFVRPWGQTFPKWVPFFKHRVVPRWILLIPGWIVGCITVLMSISTVLQFLGILPKGSPEGLAYWVYGITYGGLFIWGVCIFLATLSYQYRTKSNIT